MSHLLIYNNYNDDIKAIEEQNNFFKSDRQLVEENFKFYVETEVKFIILFIHLLLVNLLPLTDFELVTNRFVNICSLESLHFIFCTTESSLQDQSVNDDGENGFHIISEIHPRLRLGPTLTEGEDGLH